MEGTPPQVVDSVEQAVDTILQRVGKRVVLGMPLGLGKPVELVNALYKRARQDASIQLRILTALSLEKPSGSSAIENAFLAPFVERVFGGVPDLDYMQALRDGTLPPNVEVCEFFFRPGSQLNNPYAQQRYISTNYTFAARDVFEQGCNVLSQMICKRETDGRTRYSLSSNPDTGPEMLELLRESGRPYIVVGEVNQNLPYMVNDAEVDADTFDLVIDNPEYTTRLFSTPKMAVTPSDYFIGLNASALVADGGTLQIGIGALGDAIVEALRLRHADNAVYRSVLQDAGILEQAGPLIHRIGGLDPFEQGLYGSTEMFVDGFWYLMKAGILKRKVYDFWALQQLINEDRCDPEHLRADVLESLESLGVRVLRTEDFERLQHHGFFRDDARYDHGHIIAPDGERAIANVADPDGRRVMAKCLGTALRRGIVIHGGFFLGCEEFYEGMRALDEDTRESICMTGVYKVNQLDHNPRLYKQQRRDARFINTAMMATLSGAVVSDGLEDLRVVSGVGGQYNFVSMAHKLKTGRSIILLHAVRDNAHGPASNIIFNYGHTTIPRHLRDIVITEYGIADLRSRSDSEVAKALINISDSRFQDALLAQAQQAGKIERDYRIPEAFRHNTPERLEQRLQPYQSGDKFKPFPLSCDFTDEELTLGKALKAVKARAGTEPKWKLLLDLARHGRQPVPDAAQGYLQRLGLDRAGSMQDRVARMLLLEELRRGGAI